jgi:hypothetical protein
MGKILSQTSEHNEINVAVAGYCTCTKYITTESQQESVVYLFESYTCSRHFYILISNYFILKYVLFHKETNILCQIQ